MSNTLPPLLIPTADRNHSESLSTISLPSLSTWSDGYRAFSAFSSSPPYSSSPPMTPFLTKNSAYSHIGSSPGIAFEHNHYSQRDHPDNIPLTRDRIDEQNAKHSALPSFRSTFVRNDHRLSSSYDTSALYNGASTHFHEDQTYSPSGVATRHLNVFYDSEEDDQDEGAGFSFGGDSRATFFRTSAERGQWKYDSRLYARSQIRKSLPTWPPPTLPGLQLVSRPISEPAPSTSCPPSPFVPTNAHNEYENDSELPFAYPVDPLSSDMCDPRQSLPSLMSDRDTSPEQEELHSSPLPPSSPPLSHMSFPHSPMARSVSPLSFAPSSPPPVPSSPLTFSSSVDHDENIDLDDEAEAMQVSVEPLEVVPPAEPEPTATVSWHLLPACFVSDDTAL